MNFPNSARFAPPERHLAHETDCPRSHRGWVVACGTCFWDPSQRFRAALRNGSGSNLLGSTMLAHFGRQHGLLELYLLGGWLIRHDGRLLSSPVVQGRGSCDGPNGVHQS